MWVSGHPGGRRSAPRAYRLVHRGRRGLGVYRGDQVVGLAAAADDLDHGARTGDHQPVALLGPPGGVDLAVSHGAQLFRGGGDRSAAAVAVPAHRDPHPGGRDLAQLHGAEVLQRPGAAGQESAQAHRQAAVVDDEAGPLAHPGPQREQAEQHPEQEHHHRRRALGAPGQQHREQHAGHRRHADAAPAHGARAGRPDVVGRLGPHQIVTRSFGSRYMPSPSPTPKASWNASMWEAVALQRNSIGECGSIARRRIASWGRFLPRHTVAHDRNTRCRPVKPSSTGASEPSAERVARYALTAMDSPPRSPMFSPMVRAPLTRWESSRSRGDSCENWVIRVAARASKASRSAAVHQEDRLPSPSYFEPWSSKPCPISWPITAPIPPKFTASSASASKKGGSRMAAGKTISLRPGL